MQNFVQKGKTLTVTAPYALTSGHGCLVGSIFGVSCGAYDINTDAEITVEGVFDLPKGACAFSQGDVCYWNDSTHEITDYKGVNKLVGVITKDAEVGDANARVDIRGLAFSFFLS